MQRVAATPVAAPTSAGFRARTKIACHQRGIDGQVGGRAGPAHFAELDELALVGDVKRGTGSLLDEQDGHAGVAQFGDDP